MTEPIVDTLVVTLTVNGTPTRVEVEPRTSLCDLLRDTLALTGTHAGCEHGVCGACTVLVDGAPVRACITLAAACADATVTTVEGLSGPLVDRLRAAFHAEHALQCGYCTPGMLISAVDLLQRKPEASEDEIRREMSGNLCRCTGYVGLVRAIRACATPAGTGPG
ncbi:MAG: (2Fe-2S)-binding protein [Proteobacteria bacterium]|nr:(2Fe-2S)-binding protein [Burkholderiales bacterium]